MQGYARICKGIYIIRELFQVRKKQTFIPFIISAVVPYSGFVGGNFREKLERSLEIICVILNFVAIRSQIRDDVI